MQVARSAAHPSSVIPHPQRGCRASRRRQTSKFRSSIPSPWLHRFCVREQFGEKPNALQPCEECKRHSDDAVQPAPGPPSEPTIQTDGKHGIDVRACSPYTGAKIEAVANIILSLCTRRHEWIGSPPRHPYFVKLQTMGSNSGVCFVSAHVFSCFFRAFFAGGCCCVLRPE